MSLGLGGSTAFSRSAANNWLRQTLVRQWRVPRLAFIGDSITANSTGLTGQNLGFRQRGHATWARAYAGQRFRCDVTDIYATSGFTAQQILATHVPSVISGKYDVCVALVGANNVNATTEATSDSWLAIKAVYDALIAGGVTVIIVPVLPRTANAPGSSYGFTTAQKAKQAYIHAKVIEYCATTNGSYLADPYAGMIDFSTGYAPVGWYQSDGLHPWSLSAQVTGRAIADVLNTLYPARQPIFTDLFDTYDAANGNLRGNLATNGLMAGTTGSLSNSATGVVATGWTLTRTSAGTTVSVAGSKEADSAGTGLERQVITLGGTGDGQGFQLNQTLTLANFSVGDTIFLEAEMEWSGAANIYGVFSAIQIFGGVRTLDMYADSTDGPLPASSGGRIIVRTTPTTLQAGFTNVAAQFQSNSAASGSVTGTVKIGRVCVRKDA